MPRKLKKKFDWAKLDEYCSKNMQQRDCAELLQCSDDTISRRIRKEYNCTFAEYRDKKLAKTRLRLVEKALTLADQGSVALLIFCLKNLCGWVDKVETTNDIKISKSMIIEKLDGTRELLKAEAES